ncbi:SEC-C domain-containing protein [Neisseria meningitidis]|uniref:YchJ family protein n=1 Tax=Neisseria meningitidis TaxID=487 RepID=UPI0005E2FB12|nr:YchJ family protein [Neisseria meningitidis]CKK37890.1 SEC-C domain-containing protein [Neisseria meningitidis]
MNRYRTTCTVCGFVRLIQFYVTPLYKTIKKLFRYRIESSACTNIATTVPAQQAFLDAAELMQWSIETEGLGLNVISHKILGKDHAQVEFEAYFRDGQHRSAHHELSGFVNIGGQWYFIDPTVPHPAMKQPCICGSGKKFKACCGKYLKPVA